MEKENQKESKRKNSRRVMYNVLLTFSDSNKEHVQTFLLHALAE